MTVLSLKKRTSAWCWKSVWLLGCDLVRTFGFQQILARNHRITEHVLGCELATNLLRTFHTTLNVYRILFVVKFFRCYSVWVMIFTANRKSNMILDLVIKHVGCSARGEANDT